MILLAVKAILSVTCPFTSTIGGLLNFLTMIADTVFVILLAFFAPHWWYALVAVSIYFVITMLIPKVNPNNYGSIARVYSAIGSHLSPFLTIFMYIDLFG